MYRVLLIIILAPLAACAQVPSARALRVARPPNFEDFLTKRTPVEPAVTEFIQRDPDEGRPASEPTHVFILYDSRYLYLIFQCFDSAPGQIRGRMSKRDDFMDDDFISVRLDTFHDRRRAYQFTSNPLGVQGDAMHDEAAGVDNNFDTVWDSRGQLTGWGYLVMMSIPWKSLRFSHEREQTWGILFTRRITRKSEFSYWPAVSRQVTSYLAQAGELRGLSEVPPTRNVQLIPYGTLLSSHYADLGRQQFLTKTADPDAGIDAKAVLKGNLALDVTVNPDFSQVESDEPQVTVNQRWEVFFPEKRPFFLENSNYFSTPIQVFFSRRIPEPQFGARLTGKEGPWAIGALVSDDQSPGHSTDPDTAGGRSRFAVFRLNRDISQDSTAGVVYTECSLCGEASPVAGSLVDNWNRVGGFDTRWKLPREFYFRAQALVSVTQPRTGGQRGNLTGTGLAVMLNHYTRHWTFSDAYTDYSPNFRADTGYVPRVDMRSNYLWVRYIFRPSGRRLINWGPQLQSQVIWSHAGQRQDWNHQPGIFFEWRRQTTLQIYRGFGRERYLGQDFQRSVAGVDFDTAISKRWTLHSSSRLSRGIVYQPAAGLAPFSGAALYSETGLTLRPIPRLRMDHTVIASRYRDYASSKPVFTNAIFRQKVNYQFTRALSLRTIVEYDSTVANTALSALPRDKRFSADILLSYVLHPGTAIYVGYHHGLQNYDAGLGRDPLGPPLVNSALFPTTRQLFAKVSYVYRF
jgi:hypothetical protein